MRILATLHLKIASSFKVWLNTKYRDSARGVLRPNRYLGASEYFDTADVHQVV
jgi:hypothetical protein